MAQNLHLARAPGFLHAGARISPGSTLKASTKLGIGWCFAALLASSAGAETRVYGAVASNYVFRGYSGSDDKASASTGLDWQHPAGIYGGANVTTVGTGVEMDGYAGYTRQFGMFSFDLGASLYDYSDDDYINGDFREVYVGGQIGPVAVSVYRGRSPFDDIRHYWYGELNAGVPAGPVTVELHYGLRDYGEGDHYFNRELLERYTSDQYVGIVARWLGLDWRLRLTHHEDDGDVKYIAGISKSWTVSR